MDPGIREQLSVTALTTNASLSLKKITTPNEYPGIVTPVISVLLGISNIPVGIY